MTRAMTSDAADPQAEQQALLDALDSVLQPLAQLCVGKGVPIQALDERVRQAFVKAARNECGDTQSQRLSSRISSMTGLTRREVTRIQALAAPARPSTRSAVTEIFTNWLGLPEYQASPDKPLALPRLGPKPSFEALAQTVTRDVHPRSLLEALCRLKLAHWDEASDTVRLVQDAFVPRDQWAQMVAFLGDNVGDHLRAAVVNVLGQGNEHFEQTLFADELSAQSLEQAKHIVTAQWRTLMTQVVPQLEALMQADAQASRPQNQSMRLGLYSWMQPMVPPVPTPEIHPPSGE